MSGRPVFANWVRTTIADAGGITAVATSVTFTDVTDFPTVPGADSDYAYLVLVRASDGAAEIVKLTNLVASVGTIARAQEGTTGLVFAQGDAVLLRVTNAGLVDNFALKLDSANVYNGLDKADSGFALDARQGLALNAAIALRVTIASIVDDLTTGGVKVPLSAEQGKTLKTLVDAKIALTAVYNGLDKYASGYVLDARQGPRIRFGGKRQSILRAKINATTGVPDFLDIGGTGNKEVLLDASADEPFVLSFADGFDASGAVDHVAYEEDSDEKWTDATLTDNTTNYLYVDYNDADGTWTFGASTLVPTYSYTAPAGPAAGQHWFDLAEMTMKEYSGGAWVDRLRVFVGYCVVNAVGVVTSVYCYAIQGRYDSGWFAAGVNTTYTKTHYLGIDPHLIDMHMYAREDSTYVYHELPNGFTQDKAGNPESYGAEWAAALYTALIRTADDGVLKSENGNLHSGSGGVVAAGEYRLICTRNW